MAKKWKKVVYKGYDPNTFHDIHSGLPDESYEGKVIIVYNRFGMHIGIYNSHYPQGIFDSHEEFFSFSGGDYWKDAPKPPKKECE